MGLELIAQAYNSDSDSDRDIDNRHGYPDFDPKTKPKSLSFLNSPKGNGARDNEHTKHSQSPSRKICTEIIQSEGRLTRSKSLRLYNKSPVENVPTGKNRTKTGVATSFPDEDNHMEVYRCPYCPQSFRMARNFIRHVSLSSRISAVQWLPLSYKIAYRSRTA